MFIGAAGSSLLQEIKPRLKEVIDGDLLHNGVIFSTDDVLIFSSVKDQESYGGKEKPIFIDGSIYAVSGQKSRINAAGIFSGYIEGKDKFWDEINGDFSAVLWIEKESRLILVRDKIGVGTLFTAQTDSGIVFSSSLRALVILLGKQNDINNSTILRYLTFNYNPGTETFFNGITRVEPACLVEWRGGSAYEKQYWDIKFENSVKDEEEAAQQIRKGLETAVKIRQRKTGKTGAFLSGGLDSSSVVSLLSKNETPDLSTFSFRCRGESFDESPYAKIVADTFGTNHTVVEYSPESVLKAEDMTGLMHEPFSDVGINIATYLLASEADQKVNELFTGDGGDELFAGHPVYVADKSAKIVSKIPGFILKPLFGLGKMLHDSDKKKDLRVKLKRFSESYFFPKELGTHRWRVYYTLGALSNIVTEDVFDSADPEKIFKDVIDINNRALADDDLGKSLYSDYKTVVQFYLRRMDMVRSFGLNPRMPMLDPELVTFCSKISSDLKIKGMSDTKYIERKAVMPLLPYEITHRKDKLGHSVPLKNWMRENSTVESFIRDILSETRIKNRGIVDFNAVGKMEKEHKQKMFNHSHRLWSLVILELWMDNVRKNWNKIGVNL